VFRWAKNLSLRPLQADALSLLDLDDLRIVNDDLHDAEPQRFDLAANQLKPGIPRSTGGGPWLRLNVVIHNYCLFD
jgi:hypothetical protein